jgi:hypothetical protein
MCDIPTWAVLCLQLYHRRLDIDLGEAIGSQRWGEMWAMVCQVPFHFQQNLAKALRNQSHHVEIPPRDAFHSSPNIFLLIFCSFPWSLSLPKKGAPLFYPLYCWTVFLHSYAGPPDTSVPGTYGGLRKSRECLPKGRPWRVGREN